MKLWQSREGSESAESDDKDTEDVAPSVKPTSLKKFVKYHSDKRVGSEAIDLLQSHLEFTAKRLWLKAGKHAEDEGRKTVQGEDIQHAIDQLTKPHDFMESPSRWPSYQLPITTLDSSRWQINSRH